jgi:hypothetical protein
MLNKAITHNFQQYVLQPIVNTRKLLHSIKTQTLSTISNKFLTIREILKLRNTCKYFQILLIPNDKNMVMFCKDFGSKEMENVPLMWFDLKYFLKQSYYTAFDEIEMFNIKKNKYAVLTRAENIIVWK